MLELYVVQANNCYRFYAEEDCFLFVNSAADDGDLVCMLIIVIFVLGEAAN